MKNVRTVLLCGSVLGWAVACSSAKAPDVSDAGAHPGDTQLEPGASVALALSSGAQSEQAEISASLASVASLTPETFAAKYPVPFATNLGYDPGSAQGLDLIQASPLKLLDDELAALRTHGFTISRRKQFPSFANGYETIYMADLPVYISADSILEAVHRSYDDILKQIETSALLPDLRNMLLGMRASLASAPADQATTDADVYLAVALALLDGKVVSPVRDGDAALIAALYSGASSHTGARQVVLFGVSRDEDFSQFTPRGHYVDSPALTEYFQAMMWLGRIDFRIIETQSDGSQVFRRRQLLAGLRLRDLLDDASRASWTRIDAAIHAFVGDADYMTVPQFDALLRDLGVSNAAELSAIPDQRVAQAIVDGGYGTQRIASHIMYNGLGTKTLPLSSSFALLGQRYVVDSHVFSNVVYDRVQHGTVMRMMPDPLDAAFAALKNDQAGALLGDELTKYAYAPDLASMRILVESYGDSFWQGNLYNLWLSADRALSPSPELADPAKAGIASVFTTEAWGRRLLNTQLASWAELRHDTILYAKQSYTGGVVCDFPDAYVDPYPAFYAALQAYADRGAALVADLQFSDAMLTSRAQSYFAALSNVSGTLKQMADAERIGMPFTAEQLAFINQAIHMEHVCGSTSFDGWYAQLFFDVSHGGKYDPTIADVHTQPTDEGGSLVGKVLHVGTGMPRLMVVSVDTCNGAHAYAGLASSYFEQITENFERLTDQVWAQRLNQTPPDDVRWMNDLVLP
jgi:hypothetical protein